MQIIDASQFRALSGPSFLTQISGRPDTIAGPMGPRTATLRIYASTTPRSVSAMSTTFSQNTGADNKLVFDGEKTAAELIARFQVTANDPFFQFEGMNDDVVSTGPRLTQASY